MTILRLSSLAAIGSLLLLAACDGGVQNTGPGGTGGTGGSGAQGASGAEGGAGNAAAGSAVGGSTASGGQGGQATCDAGWTKLEQCFGDVGEAPPCDGEWACVSKCVVPATCDQLENPDPQLTDCIETCSDPCALAGNHLVECGVPSAGFDCDSCQGQCEADCAAQASCTDLASGGGAYGACLDGCAGGPQTPCSLLYEKSAACGLTGGEDECFEPECSPEYQCFATCVLDDTCAELESGVNFQPCMEECGIDTGGSGGASSSGVGGSDG